MHLLVCCLNYRMHGATVNITNYSLFRDTVHNFSALEGHSVDLWVLSTGLRLLYDTNGTAEGLDVE